MRGDESWRRAAQVELPHGSNPRRSTVRRVERSIDFIAWAEPCLIDAYNSIVLPVPQQGNGQRLPIVGGEAKTGEEPSFARPESMRWVEQGVDDLLAFDDGVRGVGKGHETLVFKASYSKARRLFIAQASLKAEKTDVTVFDGAAVPRPMIQLERTRLELPPVQTSVASGSPRTRRQRSQRMSQKCPHPPS